MNNDPGSIFFLMRRDAVIITDLASIIAGDDKRDGTLAGGVEDTFVLVPVKKRQVRSE